MVSRPSTITATDSYLQQRIDDAAPSTRRRTHTRMLSARTRRVHEMAGRAERRDREGRDGRTRDAEEGRRAHRQEARASCRVG
jgi:hypothetical protein